MLKKILFMSLHDKKSRSFKQSRCRNFKIASTDINNFQLMMSLKGKPVILSTAMSNFKEVQTSVEF